MVELGLGECKTSGLLDLSQTQSAVAPRAGENDANGVFALILGQGREKSVDRPTTLARWRGSLDLKTPVFHGQRGIGRNDEYPVRFDRHTVFGLQHGHVRGLAEKIGQHALVIGGQVLDEDERHPAVRRGV
jgi:hypothetical protein